MFKPPRPELPEMVRAGAPLPLPPIVPPQPPDAQPLPPGEVPDVIFCVGEFTSVDLGGTPTTWSTLPAGLSIVGQTLQGVATESFCEDVYLNRNTPTERRFRLVAIDAQTFTPQLTPEISPGYTFSDLEGNYVESCGIVTFSAKFKRHYIRNYSFDLDSHVNILWQDDLLLDVQTTVGATQYHLFRYQLPNFTQKRLQRDTTYTPVDITAVMTTPFVVWSTLCLAPVAGGVQYIYYCTGRYPDIKLRRYNLTAKSIDASFVKDVDYFRGNASLPYSSRSAALIPHAIAVNDNRIYVFLSSVSNNGDSINQAEWYKYDYNWRTDINSIVQSYDLAGNLVVSECQEGLRISHTEQLPFALEYNTVQFTPIVWKSDSRYRGVAAQSKQPGVFATNDKIYMILSQGHFVGGHNYTIIAEFPLTNHAVSQNSNKALLIDGLDDDFQGLHYTDDGDFYFGLITDRSGGYSALGGQETRGLIKVAGESFLGPGEFEVEDQAVDYVDMVPPKGTVISNCIGTVGNARGQGNLSIQTFVQDVNNKIRISYPVDYADSAEIFVTGQYKLEG